MPGMASMVAGCASVRAMTIGVVRSWRRGSREGRAQQRSPWAAARSGPACGGEADGGGPAEGAALRSQSLGHEGGYRGAGVFAVLRRDALHHAAHAGRPEPVPELLGSPEEAAVRNLGAPHV